MNMKKALAVLLATTFGGTLASATSQTTTVVMPVNATVANVCTYAAFDGSASTSPPVTPADAVGPAYNMLDVNGKTYTQSAANLGTYRANAASQNGTRNLYIHRCTSFTSFVPEKTSGVVLLSSQAGDNSSHAVKTLNVNWSLDANGSEADKPGVGDVHYGNVTFSIPAGQWNSAAGRYSGVLTLNINYQ
jgi:hypothetical protein